MRTLQVAAAQIAALQGDADLTLGAGGRVWEGVVTTRNVDGTVNVAAMGPIAGPKFDRLLLRPFATSDTHANLLRDGCGVFHLVDDVELLVRAALDRWDGEPELAPVPEFAAPRLAACTRWFAFEVKWFAEASPRSTALGRVVSHGLGKDEPGGLNRAKSAVVEAAILATRVHLLDAAELRETLDQLAIIVEKTGAAAELRALELVLRYVGQQLGAAEGGRAR
ncbi:MAG: hypothetical protein CMJ58_09500 [Planctomycetaceae bacterium]|nr:hypothetical protein [Planctomycetaceae bacterium]